MEIERLRYKADQIARNFEALGEEVGGDGVLDVLGVLLLVDNPAGELVGVFCGIAIRGY